MKAATVAANNNSSSILATKLAIEEDKLLLENAEEGATTTVTTPEGFAVSSLSLLLLLSLVDISGATQKITSFTGTHGTYTKGANSPVTLGFVIISCI